MAQRYIFVTLGRSHSKAKINRVVKLAKWKKCSQKCEPRMTFTDIDQKTFEFFIKSYKSKLFSNVNRPIYYNLNHEFAGRKKLGAPHGIIKII